jgi:hypothetical protein
MPLGQSANPDALKALKKLSSQLDTATDASEATTTKVRRARRAAETVKRAIRLQQRPRAAEGVRKRAHDRYTEDGKSKAAVELGRKGGAATAKTLTRRQRSALAVKAANTRWNQR